MPAYLIARLDVIDSEGAKISYPRYVEMAGPAYKAHDARFLVRGGVAHPMEGTARGRNVVIEYPSFTLGRACFASNAYQQARKHRMAVAEGEIVMVEGVSAAEPERVAAPNSKKGYWIARFDISDPEPMTSYVQTAQPAFKEHQARFLARGGPHEALEGVARGRNVLIEFPSVEHAINCFESETYQRAREYRRPVATGEIVIVEGA